ncbi:hypothetical protein IV203_012168 [Nitzschia inconspicua]|uniref:Uncharacterized protein n=1 Tax=Nitzschia inconspicua TaxID=303405 RepID=A0A9K3PK00_9STRA|nr:hypothetical protein IV203_012168 [Nitzschia inconspicua]
MVSFRLMVAALALGSTTAFAPVSTKNTVNTALQAGFVSELVQVATVAGAAATIYFADKSGPNVSATTVPAVAASPAAAAAAPSSADISVPYDAAAMLAYEAAGKPGDFASFKAKYLQETVAMIKSKQKTAVAA